MAVAILIITLLYAVLMGALIIGFDKVPEFKADQPNRQTRFTVLVPFRNEAARLPMIIRSLRALDYPNSLFEVIFIDDASDDGSTEIVNALPELRPTDAGNTVAWQLIRSEGRTAAPKKEAIRLGIELARHDWIVTTDADCRLPESWLSTMDSYIQTHETDMVVAPVTGRANRSLLNTFQSLEFMSLQTATIAGFGLGLPFLCNGANLAYKKDLFIKLGGFEGNMNIASGDDLFFLQKVLKAQPVTIGYLKSHAVLVETDFESSVRGMVYQRKRWSAKMTAYNNPSVTLAGILVFIMNAALVLALVLTIFGELKPELLISVLTVKFLIDLSLISKSALFFRQNFRIWPYLISAVLYPFFNIYIVVASVFGGFKWKDRRFKR